MSACIEPEDNYQVIFLNADTSKNTVVQYFGIKKANGGNIFFDKREVYDFLENYFSHFKTPYPEITYQFIVYNIKGNLSENDIYSFNDSLPKYGEIFSCVNINGRLYFSRK